MNNKSTNTANVNFILILSILAVMVFFALSNHFRFEKGEALLSGLDSEVVSSDEEIEGDSLEVFMEDLSRFGLDVGKVGLNVLRVLFVWIPIIHSVFLLLFAGISRVLFNPTSNKILVYRVLMTFAYLNIIITMIVLIGGIIIHYSTLKKFQMFIFVLQCLVILIVNFRNTFSYRIKGIEKQKM